MDLEKKAKQKREEKNCTIFDGQLTSRLFWPYFSVIRKIVGVI